MQLLCVGTFLTHIQRCNTFLSHANYDSISAVSSVSAFQGYVELGVLFSQSVQNFITQTWLERYDEDISEQYLTLLWSNIVSIFTIGGFIGATIGGTLAIRFGRYKEVFC